MAKHRAHSIKFKRQVVQEYLGGETLHSLSKRHDISRTLIRVWIQKYGTRPMSTAVFPGLPVAKVRPYSRV
jgi:transposase-like protein